MFTILLQVLDLKELHDFAFLFSAETALIFILVACERVLKKLSIRWILPFSITAVADLIVIKLTDSSEGAVFFLLWIFANALARGAAFIRENITRERTLRKQAEELRDARITALMNQIRPHFIHNTLASVYYLCDENPQKAQAVINDFMYYLQNNYNAITNKMPVPFEEELKHVQAYIAVEQVRFEGELNINYDNITYTDFRIPALTIQPLVENAVKYGIGQGISPETISIATRKVSRGSEVIIEDDGPGFDVNAIEGGTHTGIENVRIRLDLMCHGTLNIDSKPARGTKITIFIPTE